MDQVALVKSLCEQQGISMAKLERDCGFANGYIRALKKGTLPTDRAKTIADYFGVSLDYLSTGEKKEGYYFNEETAKVAQELFENPDLRMLFDAGRNATPEQLRMAAQMLRMFKEGNPDG